MDPFLEEHFGNPSSSHPPGRACHQAVCEARAKLAHLLAAEDGDLLLLVNHCPVYAAASVCQGLCALELQVFRAVLGEAVTVERTDHILAGARRCAYRVRKAGPAAEK